MQIYHTTRPNIMQDVVFVVVMIACNDTRRFDDDNGVAACLFDWREG